MLFFFLQRLDGRFISLVLCISFLFSTVSSTAVFAHVVVSAAILESISIAHIRQAGNSGSYSSQNWLDDCNKAKSAGIDGFIMNIAPNTYNLQPMLDLAYAAANQVSDFKIWLSFDYTGGSNSDGTPWHADQVVNLINIYKVEPAQYKWIDGRPAVTTFQGCDNLNDWPSIKSQTGIFFIPNYSCLGPASGVNAPGVDGLAAWDDAAWPLGASDITTNGDMNYIQALNGKPYMMPVSPWFFRNVYGGNWLWRGDSTWFIRWNQAASLQPAIIQLLTWNDYAESHYIGPLPPPGANAIAAGVNYVDNHPHEGWLADVPYFIANYKSTTAPTTEERITIWYRLNPSTSGGTGNTLCNAPDRSMAQLPPAQGSQDRIFINVMASAAGQVVADVNGHVSLNANVAVGMNHFSIPFDGWPGVPTVELMRGSSMVKSVQGARIEAPADGIVNWNAYVASSS